MPKILVVEDNLLNIELVTELLEAAGHEVCTASTAEEGIRVATAERPALILMDIRLPGMDGIAALRALRQDPRTARIPAIALTAQAMKDDRESLLSAGFAGYIAKPIDTRTFLNHLREHLPPESSA